jgi:hypothetical protein
LDARTDHESRHLSFSEAAKNAQDTSQKLYLCVYLARRQAEEEGKPIYEEAMVVDVGERSFDVIVPRYGLEKRVWLEDLVDGDEVVGSAFDAEALKLKVAWKKKGADLGDFITETPSKKASKTETKPAATSGKVADNANAANEEALWEDAPEAESPIAEKPGASVFVNPVVRRMEQLAGQFNEESTTSSSGFESDISSEVPETGAQGPRECAKLLGGERLDVLKPPTPFLTPGGRDVDADVLSEVNRMDEFVPEVGVSRKMLGRLG